MGKAKGWSDGETAQLCRSWLETSEDPVRGTGQKRASYQVRLYRHWLEHKSPDDADDRSDTAIGGRWKKINPEISKFCGMYAKIKSKERSGWTEDMYVDAALKIYEERYKQAFEFKAAWEVLRNAPKWLDKMGASAKTTGKRTAADASIERPIGRKAAKDEAHAKREAKKNAPPAGDHHARFAAAAEKKADVMERQLHYNIFMQAPHSDESLEYFQLQRQAVLATIKSALAPKPTPAREGNESDDEEFILAQVLAPATPKDIHSIGEESTAWV